MRRFGVVSTTKSRNVKSCNGVTTNFPFDFVYQDDTDIDVTLVEIATGDETALVLTTNFTLSGGSGSTGSVTTVATYSSDYQLVIERDVPYTQTTDYEGQDPFPAEVNELALDRIVMQVQQLKDIVERAIRLPITTDPDNPVSLTIPAPVAGEILVGNDDADGWENSAAADLGALTLPIAVANGGTGAATAAAARTSLGVPGLADDNVFTKTQTWAQGSDVASAAALPVDVDGNIFDVTGTTSIASLNTKGVGTIVVLQFDGILTLTHHATDLILPTGSNITTAAGDIAVFYEYATGDWRCLAYTRADGTALAGGAGALPRGYLSGLSIANNGTDSDHDIDIAVGECRGVDDDEDITLASALTKQIDATWSAGDAAGGLSSSLTAPANDTWYHVFAINVGGSADVGFDTSTTGANLIADHSATAVRRIGSVLTDGSANIIAFTQVGDWFLWADPPADYNSTVTASRTLITLSVPPGSKHEVVLNSNAWKSGVASNVGLQSPDHNDEVPSPTVAPGMNHFRGANSDSANVRGGQTMWTNTSSQVAARADATGVDFDLFLLGWRDQLGRF